jgi:hypothetical protein
MFRSGKTYRHKSCLDMDMVVVKISHVDDRRTKMRVLYVNRRGGFYSTEPETVKVWCERYDDWRQV